MFEESEFNSAVISAAEQLRKVQAALKDLRCPEIRSLIVNLSMLTHEVIEETLDDVPSGHARVDKDADFIYIIRVPQNRIDAVAELRELLGEARKIGGDYARINPRAESLRTNTIYVGRSKTLRARLRQHLGAKSGGVYSLHLQRWATSVDVDIQISYLKFAGADDLLVQAIEDGIWQSLTPAFGRKGGR